MAVESNHPAADAQTAYRSACVLERHGSLLNLQSFLICLDIFLEACHILWRRLDFRSLVSCEHALVKVIGKALSVPLSYAEGGYREAVFFCLYMSHLFLLFLCIVLILQYEW